MRRSSQCQGGWIGSPDPFLWLPGTSWLHSEEAAQGVPGASAGKLGRLAQRCLGPGGGRGAQGAEAPQLSLWHQAPFGWDQSGLVSRILVSGSAPSSAGVPVLGQQQPPPQHPAQAPDGTLPDGLWGSGHPRGHLPVILTQLLGN